MCILSFKSGSAITEIFVNICDHKCETLMKIEHREAEEFAPEQMPQGIRN